MRGVPTARGLGNGRPRWDPRTSWTRRFRRPQRRRGRRRRPYPQPAYPRRPIRSRPIPAGLSAAGLSSAGLSAACIPSRPIPSRPTLSRPIRSRPIRSRRPILASRPDPGRRSHYAGLIGAGLVRRASLVRPGACFPHPSTKLIAVEEGPDEEKEERDRAQRDRDVDEQELAGNAPRDEYAYRDDHEGRAEPDHWRSPQNARPTPSRRPLRHCRRGRGRPCPGGRAAPLK